MMMMLETKPYVMQARAFQDAHQAAKAHSMVDDYAAFQTEKGLVTRTIDGARIIPVIGMLTKRPTVYTYFNGGAVSSLINDAIHAANSDESVDRIILEIDSPGGDVDATESIANYVEASAKPVYAFVQRAESGAYWIACQAKAIIAQADTVMVGSIGVILTHWEQSKFNENMGIAVNVLHAGNLKAAGHPDKPMEDKERAAIMAVITGMYESFFEAVVKGRNLSASALEPLAQGQSFLAKKAVGLGLIDRVGTIESVITETTNSTGEGGTQAERQNGESSLTTKAAAPAPDNCGNMVITSTTAAEPHANAKRGDLWFNSDKGYSASQHNGDDWVSVESPNEEVARVATEKERERVSALYSLSRPGYESIIEKAIANGDSEEATLAAIGRATMSKQADMAEKIKDESAKAHGQPSPPSKANLSPEQQYQASSKLQAQFGSFQAFQAWLTHSEKTKKRGE